MKRSYRVAQVSKPGTIEIAERETPSPGGGEALIAVEACGICGADAGYIDRADPAMRPPRVPGHEVVGRIAALGAGTRPAQGIGGLGHLALQYARMKSGRANFSMVLTMAEERNAHQ
jgi:alcohol dehydrogenase